MPLNATFPAVVYSGHVETLTVSTVFSSMSLKCGEGGEKFSKFPQNGGAGHHKILLWVLGVAVLKKCNLDPPSTTHYVQKSSNN